MAVENDFTKGKMPVNATGPNSEVHKYYFDYYKHILLTIANNAMENTMYQHLVNHLRRTFKKHIIEERAMGIDLRDVINLEVLSSAINTLLLTEFKDDDIDIFISPGTPAMQVAWYMAHLNLGLRTRLFQLRRPEHSSGDRSEQVWVTMEKSSYTAALIIKQNALDKNDSVGEQLIIGSLEPIYKRAEKIAAADHIRVLIRGETGTGKELLANYIHKNSPRANKKFIPVNCSALSDQLLESRLFGYVAGAFTDAKKDTQGLFHEADGGTLFLDEIGDISPNLQKTLLRVLSEGQILRVGANKPEKVNVRVIAATHRDLYDLSLKGEFRSDLYYRLAISEIQLPSLREYTRQDREVLFKHLWKKAGNKFNPKKLDLPASILQTLLNYPYPGNIREMEGAIYSIWAEAEDKVTLSDIPDRLKLTAKGIDILMLDYHIRRHINYVLGLTNGNISRSARMLGVVENTVRKYMNRE
jgi:transcriptional regulator with PAS, ATPase and Fis domain